MANEQNLTQKGKRLSTEQAQRMARRSAEARKKKSETIKSAREFARAALNAELTDEQTGKTYIVKDAMIKKLIARAISEVDLLAIKYVLELVGESPQDANAAGEAITNVEKGIDIDAWIKNEIKLKEE